MHPRFGASLGSVAVHLPEIQPFSHLGCPSGCKLCKHFPYCLDSIAAIVSAKDIKSNCIKTASFSILYFSKHLYVCHGCDSLLCYFCIRSMNAN